VVRDDVVIVDRSRKVVAVVPTGSSGAQLGPGSGGGGGGPQMGAGTLSLSSEQIRQVQMVLIQKGFDIGGQPDGVLGPRTTQALIAFQSQQGFQARGQIDAQTVSALGLSNMTGQQGTVGAGQSTTSGQGAGNAQQTPANQNAPANQNVGAGQPSTMGQSGANQNAAPNQNTPTNQNAPRARTRRPTRTWALGGRAIRAQVSLPQRVKAAPAHNNRAPIKMSDRTTRPVSPHRRRRKTAIRMPAHRSRADRQNSLTCSLERTWPRFGGAFLVANGCDSARCRRAPVWAATCSRVPL
jgi:peptidoglycan hydrolase-like protein with peptidoglycan-binding domain